MTIQQLDGPWRGKDMTGSPKGIIIHSMGEYVNHQYAPDFIKQLDLSVHAFVAVDGKLLLAADTNRIAYHAGKSAFDGLQDLNDSFLGVEFLVEGHHNMSTFRRAIQNVDPYKEIQYQAGAQLCARWIAQFSMDRRWVVGHSQVAGPQVRRDPKVDPGRAFDWSKFNGYVDDFLQNPPTITIANDEE